MEGKRQKPFHGCEIWVLNSSCVHVSMKIYFLKCDFTCDVPERDPSVIRVQLDEMDRIKTQVENEMVNVLT